MSILSRISSYLSGISIVTKFALWSLVLLAMVGYTVAGTAINNQSETTHDYTYWQTHYKVIAEKYAASDTVREATEETPITINQYTLQQFPFYISDGTNQQRVDRCESCHVGVENPSMTAENIIKFETGKTVAAADVPKFLCDPANKKVRDIVYVLGAHPGKTDGVAQVGADGSALAWSVATGSNPTQVDSDNNKLYTTQMSKHAFATYGCTTCHYGSGRDLQETKAHGNTDFWLMPLMPAKYIDAACAQCHAQHNSADGSVSYLAEMKTVAKGQALFKTNACWGCHKVEGFSKGNVGPELTFEGRIATYHTIEHQLWDPRYKVNGCVMPYFFSKKIVWMRNKSGVLEKDYLDNYGDPHPMSLIAPADVAPEIEESIGEHGFVPDSASQSDVDALVCYVLAQTGLNYAESQNDRITRIAAFDQIAPPTVPTTADEGKLLFEQSGCYACHYRGDPNNPRNGHGGYAGPNLSFEGSRHSQLWIQKHYEDPQAFVPKSVMPVFPFSDTQRQALSAYDITAMPNGGHIVSEKQDMPIEQLQTYKVMVPEYRYMTR